MLVNKSTLKLLGYSVEELTGKSLDTIFQTGKQKDNFNYRVKKMEPQDTAKTFETTLKRKNDEIIPALISISRIKIEENEDPGYVCIGSDLSKEKKIKRALEESKKLYQTLVETDPDSVFTVDLDGKIEYVSQHSLKMHEYKDPTELLGNSFLKLINQRCHEKVKKDMDEALDEGILRNIEYEMLKKGGHSFMGELNIASIKNIHGEPVAFMITARDITHHKEIEKQLRNSIEEKEVLLKEVHHRVKNNLQIISSLLNLQSTYIDNEDAFEIFKESQNRVKTMAIIHEKLYQSQNFSQIDFSEYIKNLATGIYNSYGVNPNDIKLEISSENMFLDINNAIPIGLIINELLTNAIKHAFPRKKSGLIKINFKEKENLHILSVQDDGVGLSEDIDIKKTDTLGMKLITSLISQLDGKIEVTRKDGTKFKISYKLNK